ncbi:MAG: discoidin domain-containing protein [Planctomycetes bacterium]|nr:discoidin domain-containing protein [Planctomycetota bacterium]
MNSRGTPQESVGERRSTGQGIRNSFGPVVALLSLFTISFSTSTVRPADRPPADQSLKRINIALGKSYRLFPKPNYRHCTDAGDEKQLTDGKTTRGYFWTQKGTVGWQRPRYVTITVDLGRVEPIQGVSMTTAAGTAGVTWPLAVHILVSDDSKTWHNAGDLVALDQAEHGPWPKRYAIRKLVTQKLRTRGRFVQFLIVPLPGGPFVFTDEVEVFRGPAEWLKANLDRGQATDAVTLYQELRVQRALQHRWNSDRAALSEAIDSAALKDSVRQQLQRQLAAVVAGGPDHVAAGPSFRAVLPIGPRHEALFRVQAALWRELTVPKLAVRVACPWDPLPLFGPPPASSAEAIEVHTMRGEYRAAAINLANSTDRTLTVRVWLEDLPGGSAPPYVTLHEVPWTDTSQSKPVAAALPVAERVDAAWRLRVRPGLLQQLWLTFHVTDLKPGRYSGRLVLEAPSVGRQTVPVRLRVWPLDFPKQTTLWVGGWSYTDGAGSYGITPQNRDEFLKHLQEHFVNAPWATAAVLRSFRFDKNDPSNIHLDTRRLDEWIAAWPNAKVYLVFLSVAHYGGAVKTALGGAEIGSKEFNQRVATWISAWVRHLRSKGIAPNRLGLLIHDEPHEGSDITALLAWAKAIQAAEPEVIIWEDPTYRNPAAAPPELFEVCDVLCPNRPMWLDRGEPFARFYLKQRRRGRMLQFYSCSGPAKLLDPYSYYRLQAWHCWQVGGTGSFFWAFGDNGYASSWNEYYAKHGPYTPLFLDKTSVVAGKHMEAIRESVEDYEYLVMLRRAVDQAKKSGRHDETVTRAEQLLEAAVSKVLAGDDVKQIRWHQPKDRSTADRVRVELLKALTALGERN